MKTGHLKEMDCLRGVGILLIIVGHSVYNSGEGFPLLLENAVRGATGIFVFLSGFFYHHLFYERMAYKEFMVQKMKKIAVPFVVVSLLALGLYWLSWHVIDGYSSSKAFQFALVKIRGGVVLFPHWYIPFIIATFLLAPLHKLYLRRKPELQTALLVAASLISVFIHRPVANLNVVQSVVYFTPFYLLGLLFSRHRQWFDRRMQRFVWLGLPIAVGCILLQSLVFVHIGNYHKPPFAAGGVDLLFIRTFAVCIPLVGLCRKITGKSAACLTWVGLRSMQLFILHPLLSILVDRAFLWMYRVWEFKVPKTIGWSLGSSGAIFAFQLFGTLALIILLQKTLKKKSRWIMGT